MVKTGQFTTGCKGDRVLCPRNGGVRACVCVCLCVCVRVFLCVSSYLLAFLSALLDGIKAAFIGTKHFRTNIRTIVYFLVVANKRYTNTQTYTHTHRQTHGYGIYRESYSSRGKNTTNVEIKYRKDLPHNLSRMVKVKHKRPNILILILFFSTAGFLAINEITSIHQQKISLCKHSLGEDTISYRLQFYGSVRHIYAAACQLGNIMHSF